MKVIVLGGGGYIGSHICAELIAHGFSIVALDNFSNSYQDGALHAIETLNNSAIPLVRINVQDTERLIETLRNNDIRAIVYAADKKTTDESMSSPLMHYQSNISNLLSVLSAMGQVKMASKLIYLSSSSVYDASDLTPNEMIPISIHSKLGGDTPYSRAKLVSETLIHDACRFQNNLSAIILRPFSVAGSHPSGIMGEHSIKTSSSVVSALCRHLSEHESSLPVHLRHRTPDGTCIRDFVHVCDVASAVLASLRLSKNMRGVKTFNVGSGIGVSIKELMDTFAAVTQLKPHGVKVEKLPNESAYRVADISSVPIPQWQSQYNLVDICRSAWKWHQHLEQREHNFI